MRNIELIKIVLFIVVVPISINAQIADSSRIINNWGIGSIKIGQKLNKKQLKVYKIYSKSTKLHRSHGKPYFTKEYFIEDGLNVYLRKKKKNSFGYIVEYIIIKSPFKAITQNGIEIGKSNRNDVIEKYGSPFETSKYSLFYKLKNDIRLYFDFENDSVNTVSKIILRKSLVNRSD